MTGRSEQINELITALAMAQGEFPTIQPEAVGQVGGGRDKETGEQRSGRKYKYATLGNAIEACKIITAKHGLAVIQTTEATDSRVVRLVTTLAHRSGQWIEGTIELRLAIDTPQGYGSALTYARRYSYLAILGAAVDDDDDGHEASLPAPPQQRQQQRQAQRPPTNSANSPAPVAPPKEPPAGTDPKSPPAMREKLLRNYTLEKAIPDAKQYLADELKKKGYADVKVLQTEMARVGLNRGATIGVIIDSLPDLTGGGEPPAPKEPPEETPAEQGYEPSEEDVQFYGSREKAIEHHQRELAANAAPSLTEQTVGAAA